MMLNIMFWQSKYRWKTGDNIKWRVADARDAMMFIMVVMVLRKILRTVRLTVCIGG